ncbi:twin arginine protein translocation system -TatC protein [Candidatus Nitrotoga sp. BS]|uniref:twin-arginine translocase subunit TatC n=1 Tax=Candidatus Nitrotoga sp. BS TaxID=2890408 RepID=UPI001EF2031E|nr:twin-arginine translocase subunit TatC [Candidatus Nitrotoga sp. BS]CAH1199425.1 twin arginine protein translocation system -TatC protein [Candidatus Nitrotoga sp. BS]
MSTNETFVSHLLELRTRLLYAFGGLLLVFICLVPWAGELYALLAEPMIAKLPAGGQMIAIDVITPFFVPLKVAMMAAFLISLPYILYQAWLFVAPGMHKHERRLMLPLITASVVLFFFGMAFAYFLVFPVVFGFFSSAAPQGVAVMTDIDKYLSFVMGMFLAFGLTFEVPVAVVVLVKMDMINIAKLKEIRPYVIVGAFILAALVTPPDVVSQFMLAIPLWLLYEVGIIVARLMTRDSKEVETKNG